MHGEFLLATRRDDESRRNEGVRRLELANQWQSELVRQLWSGDDQLLAKSITPAGKNSELSSAITDGEELQSSRPGNFLQLAGLGNIGVDHRRRAGWKQLAEEAHLGFEVVFESRVIVEVIAGDVGEGAGSDSHAVEPVLYQPVA